MTKKHLGLAADPFPTSFMVVRPLIISGCTTVGELNEFVQESCHQVRTVSTTAIRWVVGKKKMFEVWLW